ncbi:MAG TPA: DUF3237 domain-containing protein [Caulobacteraceae bacterium]|jgi:hypothetical protein
MPSANAQTPNLPVLAGRPLFLANIAVGSIHATGGPAGVQQRVSDITGGDFTGDRLRGRVLPGGTDWVIVRGDGATLLDARIVLQTEDGALISMAYTGIRRGSADVMERLARSEDIDPASYYFRIAPRFSTSDPRYEWLNGILAVGVGHRLPGGPVYAVHEIL